VVSELKVGKTWANISGSHGDGGARERLRRVTRMVVTGELDSGPGYRLREITRMVVTGELDSGPG
jgi:hypothetical protein